MPNEVPANDLPAKIASHEGAPVPDNDLPDAPSVMDPQPVRSAIRRVGRSTATIGSGVVSTVGGAAIGGAVGGPLGAVAGAAIGGGAAPYAEYETNKALGGNPALPSWRDAAKNAVLNAFFEGVGQVGTALRAGADAAVAPEMARTAPTVKNLEHAVRNREFWKQLGLSDEQATAAIESPDAAQFYKRTVQSADRTKAAYQTVLDTTRKDFTQRYNDAYGSLIQTPVQAADITGTINQVLRTGQHELTPAFDKFLQRKSEDLGGLFGTGGLTHDVVELPGGEMYVPKKGVATAAEHSGLLKKIQEQSSKLGIGQPKMTIGDLRELKTELRENLPSNATNLDLKAYNTLTAQIDKVHDATLTAEGATAERLGQIKGIDADYSRFIDTVRKIDPRDHKFAASINDALWDPQLKNPDQAANFIRMTRAADVANPGVMPQLRASFLEKAAAEARTGNQPMQEMAALQKLQAKWGGQKGTQIVLDEMFGRYSILSNPVKLAKFLSAPLEKEQMGWIQSAASRAANAPYILRAAAITAVAGGSIYSISQHPERAPEIIGALLGLGVGAKLLGRLDRAGQASYVRFKLNPNEANFKHFMRASGAMIGAGLSAPAESGATTATE